MITKAIVEKNIEDLHSTHTSILSMILELETVVDSIYSDVKDDTLEEHKLRNRVQKKIEDIDKITDGLRQALYDVQGIARETEKELYIESYKNKVIEE